MHRFTGRVIIQVMIVPDVVIRVTIMVVRTVTMIGLRQSRRSPAIAQEAPLNPHHLRPQHRNQCESG